MKLNAQKDPDKMIWDQMRSQPANSISGSQNRTLPKLMVWLILLVSVSYVVYTLKLVSTSRACNNEPFTTNRHLSVISHNDSLPLIQNHTSLAIQRRENHEPRRETGLQHIVFGIAASAKLWEQRQKYIKVWYKPQEMRGIVWLDDKVKNQGREDNDLPSIKISGDTSRFSYTNKQGHRLFADISAILVALSSLYDVYGNLFGLLAAHPVTPLVSLHHLDVVEPIFPNATRVQALRWLTVPMKLDSAGLMQQSICYDKSKRWTVSVSWGFAVQIFRGVFSPREIEMPSRTFLNWYKKADYTAYAFNTRPVSRNPCQKPFVFYLSKAKFDSSLNTTVSEYSRHYDPHPACKWKMANPDKIKTIVVHKKPDPHLWDRSPRRNCCRVMNSEKKGSVMIHVGVCRDDEISEV
ncbi:TRANSFERRING GLYCOSYL GROUP TRANSFERASE [Salix viminalis]|uniref:TRANSFERRING GLYCOSYL GROUP TRANSFERASE n=1 Tax=Salix viminalis TaxID=40686 RepID=A0A9Q0QBR8_SALVM|nr:TRANSFERRING GLYCOSYL GROUP TRANSFERASE [Salix viminalis]